MEHMKEIARDHPRMCGEHRSLFDELTDGQGSSPHVRGAHPRSFPNGLQRGIIPACAGSTAPNRSGCAKTGDHPRMCGEHAMVTLDPPPDLGSSPHVRGARKPSGQT